MSAITLSHSPADGTLADGTSRGDSAGPVLKAHRFRYSRTLGMWYLPHSRDKSANTPLIERTAAALREAGHDVETTIDNDAVRSFAEGEAERTERAEERADRFAERADNAAARSDARAKTGHGMLEAIPTGQPILVGHHSERRDRAYRNRAFDNLEASFREADKAEYWTGRADAAASYRERRENIGTTLRRVKQLEADERFWENTLKTGHNSSGWTTDTPEQVEEINRRLAQVREKLEHWRAHIAAAEQTGVKIWSKADFQKGDFARIGGTWCEVMRVNAKTLTVPYLRHPAAITRRDAPNFLWTWTRPYDEISGKMTAKQMVDAAHNVAAKELAESQAEPQ
ncbi:hypothetical protein GCM10009839_58810 [Catenulispora yoronensis]|uniref:DUF3560 domain-containing protein n=1 Tax=Catenulispora yoronensis TaxID=450799 RepID=A0ABN2V207_9ACTN